MNKLVAQPTAAMSRKQFWTMIGGGIATFAFGISDTVFDLKFDAAVVGTVVVMCGNVAGYIVKDRAVS